ncbi:MAG TPA: hypothetical protein VGF16_08235 [Bryobacteraceae bacterium]|jgi:hypothetical protein
MNAEGAYILEAIGREEYHKALVQWKTYAQRLRRAVEAGLLSGDQMEEARRLYEWARPLLLGARAHLQAQIDELAVAAAYTRPAPPPRRRIETRL